MFMMQIAAFLIVVLCIIPDGLSQNHRGSFPPRGPPRPPQHPGFVKKWHHLQKMHMRGPPPQMRPRPIPIHTMPQKYKKPYPPNSLNRYFQSTSPVRPFWNSPSTTYRPSTEKPIYVQTTAKYPFVVPKQKNTPLKQEYDFHIQTNQIPSDISSTLMNPIQQVGEKGPIHTIPAPNLSPADKPANIEHVRPQPQAQKYIYQQEQQFQHEYHVTEASEPVKYFRNQQQTQNTVQYVNQNNPVNTPTQSQSSHQFENQNNEQFKAERGVSHTQNAPNEYYQVVQNAESEDPDDIPHHQFLQNIPNLEIFMSEDIQNQKPKKQKTQQEPKLQQLLISEVTKHQQPVQEQYNIHPLFTADQRFVEEFKRLQSQEKPSNLDLNPEFQSFNYNEQDYQKQLSKSSLVSAGYNLDYEPEASEIVRQTISRSAGSHQNVLDSTNEDSNDVEPNSIPNAEIPVSEDAEESEGFYSSLPNKEVAEALASLQAAGKINSNLMKLSNRGSNRGSNRDQTVEIYVSEVPEGSNPEDAQQDYEELGDEEEETEIANSSFGEKLKPKRS